MSKLLIPTATVMHLSGSLDEFKIIVFFIPYEIDKNIER